MERARIHRCIGLFGTPQRDVQNIRGKPARGQDALRGGYSGCPFFSSPNYLETTYTYDNRGRQERVMTPDGTITHYVYDSLGRSLRTWIGTDDSVVGGPKWTEALNGTGTSNMVKVSEKVYDNGGVGDSNLTTSKSFADNTTHYDTQYVYDWRDRQTDSRGPDGVATRATYDNLGEVTQSQTYADGDADFVIDTGELRGKSTSLFDPKGQDYQDTVYNVDPSVGLTGDQLTSKKWFDARGMLVKSADANGLFNKAIYDGAGRVVGSYTSYDDSETSYADAQTVAGDTVIEQAKPIYDADNNVVVSTSFQRLDNDTTSTGELTPTNSFIQTGATWYDLANRSIGSANFGRDNGSTHYVFNSSGVIIDSNSNGIPDVAEGTALAPNTSDDYVAGKTEYDAAGNASRGTDNKGHVTQQSFDLAHRVLKVIANYVDGVPSETETDTDQTTENVYDTQGRLIQLIAYNPQGSGNGVQSQITRYLYESPLNGSFVTSTIYPDSSDTTSSGTDQVKVTRDRLGRTLTSTDQRGVVHTYSYDTAGRLLSDSVTSLGSSGIVDGNIRRIEYGYDDLSRVNLITSYNSASGGSIVNQVATTYDGWGNVIKSQQEHSGAVTSSTPSVQYTYEDGAVSGTAKFVRLSKVTYPNGREVFYNYTTSGVGGHLSRLDNIADDSSGTTPYAQYTYMGSGTVTTETHPSVTNGLTLSYGSGSTLSGFDRFGRITDQKWTNGAGTTTLDEFTHGYDRNSNVTSKSNVLDSALSETYSYDGLDRLAEADRNGSLLQSWTLDALGNQRQVTDTSGTQTRTNNGANEITGISGVSWAQPAYDAAGNMIAGPKTGDETTLLHYKYDAWNRLTAVFTDNGLGDPYVQLVGNSYDGRGYLIKHSQDAAGTQDTYYNENWQALEVRQDGDADPIDQYIWDPRYIDAMMVRFHDDNTDGDYSDSGDDTLYPMTDANFNVTGLVDGSDGTVIERYSYLPYGQFTVLDGDFSADGDAQSDVSWTNLHQGTLYDSDAGLYDVRNRFYSPTLGRWIQEDPAGYVDGLSRYVAFSSTPVDSVDPSGLKTWKPKLTAGNALHVNQSSEDGIITHDKWEGLYDAQPKDAELFATAESEDRWTRFYTLHSYENRDVANAQILMKFECDENGTISTTKIINRQEQQTNDVAAWAKMEISQPDKQTMSIELGLGFVYSSEAQKAEIKGVTINLKANKGGTSTKETYVYKCVCQD
jgi:RHS repeat-associated protein